MALFGAVRNNLVVQERVKLLGLKHAFSGLRTKSGVAQNQGTGRKKRFLGLKVHGGSHVLERDIVLNQQGLRYHPGLNAGLDARDNSIYAVREGAVVISTEHFLPNLDHKVSQKYYTNAEGNIYKRYINIVPLNDPIEFKLIDLV